MAFALVVGNSNAQDIPGEYGQFEKVNFSLTLKQQASAPPYLEAGNWTVRTMRMGNKEMLKYLADAFHTNWPVGAQLAVLVDTREVIPYSLFRELYILDKAGNPLMSADLGYSLNETNYAYFRINCGAPVTVGKSTNSWSPITREICNVTHFQILSFQFYRIEDDPSVTTDLELQGLDTEKYNSYLYSGPGVTLNARSGISISEKAYVSGAGLMNDTWTVVGGWVTIEGKWNKL